MTGGIDALRRDCPLGRPLGHPLGPGPWAAPWATPWATPLGAPHPLLGDIGRLSERAGRYAGRGVRMIFKSQKMMQNTPVRMTRATTAARRLPNSASSA